MRWIKNTSGKPDAMLTLAVVGFVVVVLKLLFAGNAFAVAGATIDFGPLSAAEIAAILTPTIGAYVARRHTDCKYHLSDEEDVEDDA